MVTILKNSKATGKSVLVIVIVVLLAICVTAGFIVHQLMPITPASTPSPTASPMPIATSATTPNPTPTAINPNEGKQINVKITDFSMIDKQWWYLGGLAFDCRFNMTIENKGISNLTGLELKVKLFNNGSEVQVGNYFVCASENGTVAETLHAGEVRSCDGTIMCSGGDAAYGTNLSSNKTAIVAQVILNNNILDEKTATLP